jgi:hypothetical protein
MTGMSNENRRKRLITPSGTFPQCLLLVPGSQANFDDPLNHDFAPEMIFK